MGPAFQALAFCRGVGGVCRGQEMRSVSYVRCQYMLPREIKPGQKEGVSGRLDQEPEAVREGAGDL